MQLIDAEQAAIRAARRTGETYYVVYSREDEDRLPSQSYHLATEYDLDTYYAGIHPNDIVGAYAP